VAVLTVDLLYWDGCPSHPQALRDVERILRELGRPDVTVRQMLVESDEQARRLRFPGSPTLRVNGADLIEQAPDDIIGLTCRLYWLSDGRPSPTPDPEALRTALIRALG
jgi:hypothetical protein